jgi:hypothetical protein
MNAGKFSRTNRLVFIIPIITTFFISRINFEPISLPHKKFPPPHGSNISPSFPKDTGHAPGDGKSLTRGFRTSPSRKAFAQLLWNSNSCSKSRIL